MSDDDDAAGKARLLRERVEAVRRDFAATLPGRVEELHGLWVQVRAGECASDVINELHRQAHTLKGSAPSFGYDDVGRLAGLVDAVAQALAAGERALTAEAVAHVDDCLATLRELVHRAGDHD